MRLRIAHQILPILFAGVSLLAASAASAHQWLPAIPPELGPAPAIGRAFVPYRCSGAVFNFYDEAWYGGEPPAAYLGYAYRPHHLYTAYRILPRTYFCAGH